MSPEIDARPAVPDLYFEMAGDQIMGAQSLREIAFIADYLDDKGGDEKNAALIVMADGMAGSSAGQIVASLVCSTFNNTFTKGYGHAAPAKLLLASLDKANATLSNTVRETSELTGMACTLISAALMGEKLHWASVGDSHLYLIRDGQLQKLNADHSYGGYLERLRADGVEVEADADIAPDMLMSAVNGEAISEIDCREQAFMLRANDRILIASPGFNALDNNTILRTSASCSDAKGCVAALLRGVKEIGEASYANTTVIVVDMLDRNTGDASKTSTAGGNAQSSSANAATASTTVQAAPPSRRSMLLDTLTTVAAVLIFAGAAFASWQGLGYLNEFRRAAGPSPDAQQTASSLPSSAPVPQSAATPGLSFGTPPPGSVAPSSASGGGSSLSFGAPPLPSPAATTTPNDPLPSAPMQTAAGEVFRDPLSTHGEGPLMVPIPAGQFQMGSKARAQERPTRAVTIEAFAISRFEVTVEQYERFAGDSKRKMPNIDTLDDKKLVPINGVSWDDAYAYTRWLSAQTGKRYRLPSEAQWEYAASGGATSAYWWGPTVGEGRAHCQDCNSGGLDPHRPTRAGRFAANPFTLFDTAGNVAEWVHDCWHPNYRDAPQDGDVWEGGDCTARVVRGGSFRSPASAIRTSARAQHPSTEGASDVGFRVARDM